METITRRQALLDELSHTSMPIKGQELALKLKVSRQVIVQDIAILRAQGISIVATPAGYMNMQASPALIKVLACTHEPSVEAMRQELELMVRYGAKVIDVIVEHPVYGEIRAVLNLKTLHDVDVFIEKSQQHELPLSLLTQGIHFHTIEVENEHVFLQIKQALQHLSICS